MSERKKLSILINLLGNYYSSGKEKLFYCPVCQHSKNKLSVNLDKDVFKCWICDYRGPIRRIVRRVGSYSDLKEWDSITQKIDVTNFSENLFLKEEEQKLEKIIQLPKEFISLTSEYAHVSTIPAQKYLKRRGISKKDIIRWKIGCCVEGSYAKRIIIPSFSESGYCNYFTARSYYDTFRKYMNPPADKDIIYNDLYISWDNDLVLVEGIFDAIVAGPNSVPILGSTLREGSRLFQKIIKNDTPIYIALDLDADKKSLQLIKDLLQYDIETYKIDIFPYKDVAEMPKEEFLKRKENATFMTESNYLVRNVWSL